MQQRCAQLSLLPQHVEVRGLVQRLELRGARVLIREVHAADRERCCVLPQRIVVCCGRGCVVGEAEVVCGRGYVVDRRAEERVVLVQVPKSMSCVPTQLRSCLRVAVTVLRVRGRTGRIGPDRCAPS